MSEDLLLEPKPDPAVEGSLENIEDLVREAIQHAVQVGLARGRHEGLRCHV